MGSNHLEKVPKSTNQIGVSIAIAIGCVSEAPGGPSQNKKNEKNKANGNGNAHANFDWYFLVLFFKMVQPYLPQPHLAFSDSCSTTDIEKPSTRRNFSFDETSDESSSARR